MGKKGKERIKSQFTLEKHLKTIDDLMLNVVENKKMDFI
jgi:hypothetical protein